ncbi:uncharacterized protein MYCFIDRAFT_198667 [Pseudocercospora fijiensis CIRAD86]|uniref:RING-type domain-containing protein n=1 Tax=Pseudocercospora fijiensis (strain CIRAD86) TaxID=383855 RepID=M3ATF9_PSEFD|nr:uncharacterized protein MYCFIDRAFT_198667 [Pseudocercospora fijiensis CIRAD86]EME80438.1 hypothetical protein MYCFIDRAFT_198667 [Pseudocercospora fijiensis CIRAD86]
MPSLPVALYGIETDREGTRLRLSLPQGRKPVLLIECGEVPEKVLALLRSIALPVQPRATTSRQQDRPASLTSCSLTRSAGPTFTVVRLHASLKWRSGFSAFPAGAPVGAARVYPDYQILLDAYPDAEREAFDHSQPFTPQDFYEGVHAPSKDVDTPEHLYRDVLESDLYPFQKRAVTWMLNRESVGPSRDVSPFTDAGIQAKDDPMPDTRFFHRVMDASGQECWVNHLQGVVSRMPPQDGAARLSGGLLAEEMGLGKTVELMALVALNTRPRMSPGMVFDRNSGTKISPSKATLIVTPSSLTQQWKSELERHAPDLNIFHYEGISTGHGKKKDRSDATVIRELCEEYDVVITTYQVLGREIHFAEDPPDRAMRHARKHERKRSPLVQIEWWRVVLDEAQMVESGVTAAARVACRLPRVHSWAVSGTPLRKDVQDLLGLLIFLRYEPFANNGKLWSHLITNHRHHFRKIFGEIALRHTKAQIRDELQLPPQKRVVVTVPFSVIEHQNYTELFDQMCEEIGLNKSGEPIRGDWDPSDPRTTEAMRSWLVRLRQTCLHPQVGGKNRRALGRGTNPLRTVAQVLELMIEQNETSLRTEERTLAASSLQRAHILGNNQADQNRSHQALEIYNAVLSDSEKLVQEARSRLAAAKAADPGASSDTENEDSATESTPLIGRLKSNLRTALQVQHQAAFYAATSYYQIKSNESLTKADSDEFKQLEAKEVELYETAKIMRKELMRETFRKAESFMRRLRDLDAGNVKKFTQLPKVTDLPSTGGIESRRIVEKSDELFDVIREQVAVLKEWRAKMTDFLIKPLVDTDDGLVEITGDEYEDSTKQQDELYVYFDAFKAVHADLNALITNERTSLIDHEVKEAVKRAEWVLDPDLPVEQKPEEVHAPQLKLDLYTIRNKLRSRRNMVGSIRSLIQEARSLEVTSQFGGGSRLATEGVLIQGHIDALQAVFSAYTKALAGLDKELQLFRTTQNQRVEFYKQLQDLSDSVAPYKDELDTNLDQDALGVAMQKEEQSSSKLQQLQMKGRFLINLREEDSGQSGPRTCIICISTFERGVLTICGHTFCKECLQQWFQQKRCCPTCKRKLGAHDLHDITFKPQEIRLQEESAQASSPQSPGNTAAPSTKSIYSDVDSRLMDEIKSIDLPTSYGTKIDTLGRHLHWIRDNDPGAKSIIFSQYREFLDVLGGALRDFKIGFARLGRSGAVEKFRNDASIDCLLLDAKTDSSGLTLVNATHVFVCEPLIQTAVELQAIARVHRIGQTRPTTVWMYLINDTVEEAIYETSVARRLAHVQSREQRQRESQKSRSATPAPLQENAIDAANSEELQSAPLTKLLVAGKSGGEMVANDDLWQCLFGKAQKLTHSAAARQEIGRHLRAEAAEARAGAQAPAPGPDSNEAEREALQIVRRHEEL